MMNNLYKTIDRYLIAWLRYRNHKFVKIEKNDLGKKKQISFYFNDSDELQVDVMSFYNKELFEMSPHEYTKELDSVMKVIFQNLNN